MLDKNHEYMAGERFVAVYKETKYIAEAEVTDGATFFRVVSPRDYKGPTFENAASSGRLAGNSGTRKNGKEFMSLNALMMAIVHPSKSAPTAYLFWTPEADYDPNKVKAPRTRVAATATGGETPATGRAAKPTAKQRAFNPISLLDPQPAGLANGETAFWCSACQTSFTSTDANVKSCPQGHSKGMLDANVSSATVAGAAVPA